MSGITILSESVRKGAILMPWFGIGLSLLAIALALCIFWLVLDKCNHTDRATNVGIAATALVFAAIGFAIGLFAPREEIKVYKVTIDETVSYLEFTERYKVIEQDGLIYTLEERESN